MVTNPFNHDDAGDLDRWNEWLLGRHKATFGTKKRYPMK